MNGQMKKGVLEMCILYEISRREQYGYEILKTISQAFPDVDPGTVYANMRRLHADGNTETYFGEGSNGPRRKYYRITQQGKGYLEQCIENWQGMIRAVRDIGIP